MPPKRLLRTMATTITGGMKVIGAGMACFRWLWPVELGSGRSPAGSCFSGRVRAGAERPGILKPEGGRASASDASAAAADDSFERLPKVSFASDDDPAAAPADASGECEVPLLVETTVIQCQERLATASGLTAASSLLLGMLRASTASKCTDAATAGSCFRSVCMLEVLLEVLF